MRTSRRTDLVAADPADDAVLERAQELGLHLERQLADLVEEHRAAGGGLEDAAPRRRRRR
jgi:hypothetical protein